MGKKKPGPGRPPKSEEEKHTERIVSLLTRSQFQDLLNFQADKGISDYAQAVRTLVLEGIKRHKAKKIKPPQ